MSKDEAAKGAAKAAVVLTAGDVSILIQEAIKDLISNQQLGDVVVKLVTKEELKELETKFIPEELQKLATKLGEDAGKKFGEMLIGLITEDRARAIFAEEIEKAFDQVQESPALLPYTATLGLTAAEETPPLDPDWLTGLQFRGSTVRKELVDGRPKLISKTFTRSLQPEDVLTFRVNGDIVTIVTTDGQKHQVEI